MDQLNIKLARSLLEDVRAAARKEGASTSAWVRLAMLERLGQGPEAELQKGYEEVAARLDRLESWRTQLEDRAEGYG